MNQEVRSAVSNQIHSQKMEQIDESISRIKTELEYEFLISMREANDLEQSL